MSRVRLATSSYELFTRCRVPPRNQHCLLYTSFRRIHRCDSQFVNPRLHPLMSQSIVVHLGDDQWVSSHLDRHFHGQSNTFMPNSLTVPYRISHWVPDGLPLLSRAHTARPLLLSMNVDYERSKSRATIASAVRASALSIGLPPSRLNLTEQMLNPRDAAILASASTFCLCPTGDSKGFTARFYFSLLHGCLPVRVDGWERDPRRAPPAYPFPELLDWSRLVLDIPLGQVPSLLPRLATMSTDEIESRQRYLRRVAHYFLYDFHAHRHHDAPAALTMTLEMRLGLRSSPPLS